MPPAWMANKSLAPTWMFPSATFIVEVKLMPELEDTKDYLKRLVSFMEERNGTDWNPEEMGKRFDLVAARGIAFAEQFR